VLVVGSLFLAGSASRPVSDGLESIPGARETDKAERLPLPGTNYRQTEGLLQKSDGTYIQIDFFELPPPK
jgi:hypothetical protein